MIVRIHGKARSGKTELINAAIAGFVGTGRGVIFLTDSKPCRFAAQQAQKQMEQLNPRLKGLLKVEDPRNHRTRDIINGSWRSTLIIDDADMLPADLLNELVSTATGHNMHIVLAQRTV